MKAILILFAIGIGLSNSMAQNCQCASLVEASEKHAQHMDSIYAGLKSSSSNICTAKYFEWLGVKYLNDNNLDSVEVHLVEAEKRYNQQSCNEASKIFLYKKWAELYYRKADFSKSLAYCLKLSKATEQSGDAYEQANVNTMIAQLFNQMGQADKGITYARTAVPLIQKIKVPEQKADVVYKLSKRYLWHYQDFGYQPSLDSFEILANEHLNLSKQLGSKQELAKAYSNMQGAAYERKNFKLAIAYLDSSNLYLDANDWLNKAVNYFDLADLYLQDKNYNAAKVWADSSIAVYQKLGDIAFVADAYVLLSRIHREAGDHEAALLAYEKADHIADSLINVEKSAAFIELEKKYNQEKNEQKIKELSQQQIIYLLLTISAIMIAIVIGVLLRQKNLKQRQTILETEQRLNRARMNPHFFFNALASLQEHASRESDGLKVASSLAQFSKVMRKTLESTYHDMITIEAEMDFLNQYLAIQQMRFMEPFKYTITASDSIIIHEQSLPSMLLQPFVENSIEHGFAGMKSGELSVHFEMENNELHVIIEDNGKGFNSTENKTHISRATQIIQDRLYLLNLRHQSKARFTIQEKPVGVRADVYLPLIYV